MAYSYSSRPSKLIEPVDVVISKFDKTVQKDLDRDIITKTKEALRFLNLKVPNMRLGNLDSPEIRAAILLEYVAREEKNVRLSMAAIAKALGIRSKANLESLHQLIGNYRRTDVTRSSAAVIDPRTARDSTSSKSGVRQTRKSAPPVESTIPRLAIRLSSFVTDPNGFANKSQQLFRDILAYVETLSHLRKQDFKLEIQQHRSAYEAACFFHVVSATQTKKLSRVSSKSQQRQQSSSDHGSSSNNNRDDDRNRDLQIEDILEASADISHIVFKQVLKHLEGMLEGIEQNNLKKQKTTSKPSASSSTQTSKAVPEKYNPKAKGKTKQVSVVNKRRDSVNAAADAEPSSKRQKSTRNSLEQPGTSNTERDSQDKMTDDDSDSDNDDDNDNGGGFDEPEIESFQEWRKEVLVQACRQSSNDEPGEALQHKTHCSEALAFAADQVLRKFGLIE